MVNPIPEKEGQRPKPEDHGSRIADAADLRPLTLARYSAGMRALTGLLLLAAMAGGVWAFVYWEPRLLPIRVIEVQGALHHHSSELLQKTIGGRLTGGILTANLEDLKRAAEDLAWVGKASLRRVWPDRLQVRVEEHKPTARWGRDGLVTAEGLVFHPRTGTVPAGLPMLDGDVQYAPELVARYLRWRDDLMLVGQLIDGVARDARGSWRLDLVSGTRVELGTDHIEQRLARFIGAVSQLEAAGQADVVDMRYSNGFAVKWTHSAEPLAGSPTDSAIAVQKTSVTKGAKGRKGARSSSGKPRADSGARSASKTRESRTASPAAAGKSAKKAPGPNAAKPAVPRAAKGPGIGAGARIGAPVTEGSIADRKLQAQTDRSTRLR